MSADVTNSFIQSDMSDVNELVIMKITGVLVDPLVLMDPEVYVK